LFVHVTWVPTATFNIAGVKAKLVMLTACPVALGAGVADTGVTPLLAGGLATAA
jgi:hypothetical protein